MAERGGRRTPDAAQIVRDGGGRGYRRTVAVTAVPSDGAEIAQLVAAAAQTATAPVVGGRGRWARRGRGRGGRCAAGAGGRVAAVVIVVHRVRAAVKVAVVTVSAADAILDVVQFAVGIVLVIVVVAIVVGRRGNVRERGFLRTERRSRRRRHGQPRRRPTVRGDALFPAAATATEATAAVDDNDATAARSDTTSSFSTTSSSSSTTFIVGFQFAEYSVARQFGVSHFRRGCRPGSRGLVFAAHRRNVRHRPRDLKTNDIISLYDTV